MTTNTKREQERAELYKALWKISEDLRGNIDGWDFKAYILNTLLYRFLSERLIDMVNENERKSGSSDFNYASISDEDAENGKDLIIDRVGYYIRPSHLFCNVAEHSIGNSDINILVNDAITEIISSSKGKMSEELFDGMFDDYNVTSARLGNTPDERKKKLAQLIYRINSLNFGNGKDRTIDLFGDAYEWLMGRYASAAGRAGGEYFTPPEVSELLTRLGTVGKSSVNRVYDCACGSGSLLLKAQTIFGDDFVKGGFYGQEYNATTHRLGKANMLIHGVDYTDIHIALGDTLVNPKLTNESAYDLVVMNPPYSVKWESKKNPVVLSDPRFTPTGTVPPASAGDYGFILDGLYNLAATGTEAVVCFPGILYRTGAEQKIRKYLIDNNFVDAIIQLPDNLFFGTTISTCIMILKKNKTDDTVAFIDASAEYEKVTNSNKLSDDNIQNIVNYYADRANAPHVVQVVAKDKIEANDYNLAVSTYVEKKDTTEKIDINVLHEELAATVEKETELRNMIAEIVKSIGV